MCTRIFIINIYAFFSHVVRKTCGPVGSETLGLILASDKIFAIQKLKTILYSQAVLIGNYQTKRFDSMRITFEKFVLTENELTESIGIQPY